MKSFLKEHIRDYAMFIALFVVMLVFSLFSKEFLSPVNISNLVDQTGYIAVLAIGETLIIIIRHIDLSVGFLSGFLGAVAAILMEFYNVPAIIAIFVVLFLGTIAGLLNGSLVSYLRIPAFVATLAGWLGYRGALLLATSSSGTIIITNKTFNSIGNGFIPDIPFLHNLFPRYHTVTLLVGIFTIIILLSFSFKNRVRQVERGIAVKPRNVFLIEQIFIIILIGFLTLILSMYRGISWTFVIVLLVTAIYSIITQRTVLGRHIYAVGGNPEAAALSGVNVQKVTLFVFASMGFLSGLSGILFASRLQSATTTAGSLFELYAIAGAFIGGVSAAGGVGKIINSLIGAFVMSTLTNGMNLLGVDISLQYIILGIVLAIAVIFDVTTRRQART